MAQKVIVETDEKMVITIYQNKILIQKVDKKKKIGLDQWL